MKKSFIIYTDSLDVLDELDDKQTADLFRAIRDYQNGQDVILSGLMRAIFLPFRNQFERDLEKYEIKTEKARESARIRWDKNAKDRIKKDANACERTKRNAFDADNVNDNVNVNDNANDNVKEEPAKPKRTPKPELDISFFSEKDKQTIKEWIEHRKNIKKQLNQNALQKIKEDFDNFGSDEMKWCIAQSIKNGWQGYFTKKIATDYVPSQNSVSTKSNPHRLDSSELKKIKTLKL